MEEAEAIARTNHMPELGDKRVGSTFSCGCLEWSRKRNIETREVLTDFPFLPEGKLNSGAGS